MPSAPAAQAGDARRADEVRVLLRWMALGAAAGSLSGLIVGGLGGRLLMLALRERSPAAQVYCQPASRMWPANLPVVTRFW